MNYFTNIVNEVFTWCHPGEPITINYGALYNWYATTDARNICNAGWHIPTDPEFTILTNYLIANNYGYGGSGNDIGKAVSWTSGWSPSAVAGNVGNDQASNNSSGFNIRAGGFRVPATGVFMNFSDYVYIWTSTQHPTVPTSALSRGVLYNFSVVFDTYLGKKGGEYNRPLKDSTILTHGETGTYTGNDGKIYRTICIGTQEWVADNIAETKYRDGTYIPIVTDDAAWVALVTGAMCYYNNDSSFM